MQALQPNIGEVKVTGIEITWNILSMLPDHIERSFIQVLFSFLTQEGALSRRIFIIKINEIISSKERGSYKTVLPYSVNYYSTQY